jgi:hypothetical protein
VGDKTQGGEKKNFSEKTTLEQNQMIGATVE